MKILKITLRAENDFHTMGNTQGSTSDILTDAEEVPYIPGTHVKGVMRTEAERILRKVNNIQCRITGDWEQGDNKKKELKTCDEVKKGGYGCEVCSLFGAPNKEGGLRYREGKMRVMDFNAKSRISSTQRMHVSINRDSQSKIDGGLYSIRTVPSGTDFTGYIILKDLDEKENRLFNASLHSMVHYGLGGERSRGLGSFKIEDISEVTLDEYLKEGGAND